MGWFQLVEIKLNCEQSAGTHGVTLEGPDHTGGKQLYFKIS